MEGQEIVTNELIIMLGPAPATRERLRFAELVIGGLIVALAIGGFVM
jgi:hypothetical protein